MRELAKRFWPLALMLVVAGVAGGVLLSRPRGSDEAWLAGCSLSELKRLADAPGSDPLPCLAYGEKLARNNRPQEALDAYQRGFERLDRDRHDSVALRIAARMGYQLAVLEDDERARLYLDHASRIDKGFWLVWLGEGVMLLNQHDSKRALAQFRRAVSLQPQSYEAHYYMAVVENEEKETESAERELRSAVAIAPEFAPTHAELGRIDVFRNEYAKAAQQIREARRLEPDNTEYLFGLAKVLSLSALSQEDYREAVKVHEECRRSSPGSARLLLALGQLHLRFLNLDEAFDCLKQANGRNPDELVTLYSLARVADLRGDPTQARLAYTSLDRRLGLRDKSIKAERRVAAHPNDPLAHLEYARCLRATNNLKSCYAQLKAALALRPDLTEAQAELARLQTEFQQRMDSRGNVAAGPDEKSPADSPSLDQAPSSESQRPTVSVP